MSYLIVFRVSPDVDHMAPLAWKLLEDGEEVHAVVAPGYDVEADHRLGILRAYERFHLHRPGGGLDGRWRATLPYALWLVRRHRIRLVAVEWGYGIPAGYERPRSAAGLAAIVRTLGASLLRAGSNAQQPRASFIAAARLCGAAVVCLPHGLTVKLDAASNGEVAELLERGALDWSDRNRFDAYVLNTEHHRRIHLDHARGDPDVMQTWGSLRWSPEWFELNRRLAPPLAWPGPPSARVKVAFMVPKWRNRVDAPATIALFRRLHELDAISLAVVGHPRPGTGGGDPLRAAAGIDWSRVHDLSRHNSVSIIREADVVIDAGSSIGIEVLMQDKVLVNPSYLHELETLFDTVAGCCVVARDADDVVGYLLAHASGRRHRTSPDARAELLRHAVYGSSEEPYDVIGLYAERVRALAAGRGDGGRRAARSDP
ncbi:MAG: hypothetical protein Q8O56_17220 [Solirubrobacteraceae bacterium]|nr:hypothetical protein [Solirubrobacteraceae bacterium]